MGWASAPQGDFGTSWVGTQQNQDGSLLGAQVPSSVARKTATLEQVSSPWGAEADTCKAFHGKSGQTPWNPAPPLPQDAAG